MKDLSKGKLNQQSKSAFKKLDAEKDRQKVFSLINGKRTTKDIMYLMKKEGLNHISGRFTELKLKGIIECIGCKNGYSIYKKVHNDRSN